MIEYEKVKKYIENKNNIKLTHYQSIILVALINKDIITTPRISGRTFIYDGYIEYLKENNINVEE